jgi:hypothetical protein
MFHSLSMAHIFNIVNWSIIRPQTPRNHTGNRIKKVTKGITMALPRNAAFNTLHGKSITDFV